MLYKPLIGVIVIYSILLTSECCVQQGSTLTCEHLDGDTLHLWFRYRSSLPDVIIAVGLESAGNYNQILLEPQSNVIDSFKVLTQS